MKKEPWILILLLLLQGCSSFIIQKKLKILDAGENFSIYEIDKNAFLHTIPEHKFDFNYKNDVFTKTYLENALASVKYNRSNFTGVRTLRIFQQDLVSFFLNSALPQLQNNKILYCILIYPDTLARYTRINRITFYLLFDTQGLHIIFGELFQNLNFEKQYNFDDWNNVSPFIIKQVKTRNIIVDQEFQENIQMQYAPLGLEYNWLTILPPLKRKEDKQPLNSLEKKLKYLKELKEKKLIDENIYREKVKELLKQL